MPLGRRLTDLLINFLEIYLTLFHFDSGYRIVSQRWFSTMSLLRHRPRNLNDISQFYVGIPRAPFQPFSYSSLL